MYDRIIDKFKIVYSTIASTTFASRVPDYINTWVYNTEGFSMDECDCYKVFIEEDNLLYYVITGMEEKTDDFVKIKRVPRPGHLNEFTDLILIDFNALFGDDRITFMLISFSVMLFLSRKLIPTRTDILTDPDYDLATNAYIISLRNSIRLAEELFTGLPLQDSSDLKDFSDSLSGLCYEFGFKSPVVKNRAILALSEVFIANDNVIQSGGLRTIIKELNETHNGAMRFSAEMLDDIPHVTFTNGEDGGIKADAHTGKEEKEDE